MLFKIVFATLLVAVVSVHSKCSISDHVAKHDTWVLKKNNIYGNKTEEVLVKTWVDPKRGLEEIINQQINKELFAHYTYTSMHAHFLRDDIYLPGFAKFFKEAAEEEYKHATMLMEYLNKRGGRVKLQPIMVPCQDAWGTGLMAMTEALKLEKIVYLSLLDVHKVADTAKDAQMMDFIEANFLGEQVDSIKLLGNYIGTLKRLGGGLGEYQFDKITLGGGK